MYDADEDYLRLDTLHNLIYLGALMFSQVAKYMYCKPVVS